MNYQNIEENVNENKINSLDRISANEAVEEIEKDAGAKDKMTLLMRKKERDLLNCIYQKCFEDADISETKSRDDNRGVSPNVLIDVVSGKWVSLSDEVNGILPSFVEYEHDGENKWFLRNDKAFYYGEQISPLKSIIAAFDKSNPSYDIIRKSVNGFIKLFKSTIDERIICLVPDCLGDFKDNVKNQLRAVDVSMIQIPRSIAAAYTYIMEHPIKKDAVLETYDFEGTELSRTEIRIHYDADNECYEYTRMGRRHCSEDSWNYKKIAYKYIVLYEQKYQVKIPKVVKDNLINSKDIEKVLTQNASLAYMDCGNISYLRYDYEIAKSIINLLNQSIEKKAEITVFLTEIKTVEPLFYCTSELKAGCLEINKRIHNSQIIWKEYLPELSLEVIRDGKFESLKLIDKNFFQDITENTMDEEILIPINNGSFILPNGKDKVFCPLTREEFGSMQRDKMAMFSDKRLAGKTNPIIAELSLRYHYGDPDSYKLIAKDKNSDIEITSIWCDESDQVMGNEKFPEYSSPEIRTKATMPEIICAMNETIDKLYDWHNFVMTGGYNHTPPFDQNRNWLALKKVSYIRLSLPASFAPNKVNLLSKENIDVIHKLLQELIYIYDDCQANDLSSMDDKHPCDLEKEYLRYIEKGVLDIFSLMSGLYVTNILPDDLVDRIVYAVIDSKDLQYIIPLSNYVQRNKDSYGIWDEIESILLHASDKCILSASRTIGTVCWRQPNWMYEFGKCDCSIADCIVEKIISECSIEIEKISSDYNPRKIRDLLEAMLGLTRLKECGAPYRELLDCNSQKIKEFVSCLKELNEAMENAESRKWLLYPFVSRLEMNNPPEELKNINKVIYPLLEILTDGNAIKLTGFTEQELEHKQVHRKTNIVEENKHSFNEKLVKEDGLVQEKLDEEVKPDNYEINNEELVKKQARRLVVCLDREGMNNERMKNAANFRIAYNKFMMLMKEEHPSIAKKMEEYGEDYMSSLMYLRRFYKG